MADSQFQLPEGAVPLASLTPEEQAEIQQQTAQQSSVPAGAVPLDQFIRDSSPQDLFEMAIQTKDSDAPFDPVSYLDQNPDLRKDPSLVSKLADADAYVRDRGFEWSDVDLVKAAEGLWHMGKSFVVDRPKEAYGLAKAFVKSKTADTEDEEFEQTLIAGKKGAELLGATELAAFDFIDMFGRAGSKIKELFKNPLDQAPEDRSEAFLRRVDKMAQRSKIAQGEGETGTALGLNVAETLKELGHPVDPETVQNLSASDPLVFLAFPGGIKVAHAATGKVLATVANRVEAVQLVNAMRAARTKSIQAAYGAERAARAATALEPAAMAGAAGADVAAAAGRDAAVTAAEAAFNARTAATAAESAVAASPAARFVQQVPALTGAAGRVVERGTQAASDVALGTAIGAAGVGATVAEKLGKTVAAFIPPIATPRALRVAYEGLGKAGRSARSVAGNLIKDAPSTFTPGIRAASDVARGAADLGMGATRGFFTMDLPLAAVTAERPEETAHMPVFGAALGAAGRAIPGLQRAVTGQRIGRFDANDPRARVNDLRHFSGLDQGTKFSLDKAGDENVNFRLAALRDFIKPAGGEIYFLSGEVDPATGRSLYGDAIRRYFPGQEEAWYQRVEQTRGLADTLVDDAGVSRKVAIFKELDAAPHEAVHVLESILGERATNELRDMIWTEYAPIWEQVGESYARRLVGPETLREYAVNGEGWREAILDNSLRRSDWRNSLTPEQVEGLSNKYLTSEFLAEVGDAIFKNGGKALESKSWPGRVARVLGKVMNGIGIEPFAAGTETEGQNIPLSFRGTEAIREGLQTGIHKGTIEARRPDIRGPGPVPPPVVPRGSGPIPPVPTAPVPPRPGTPPPVPTIPVPPRGGGPVPPPVPTGPVPPRPVATPADAARDLASKADTTPVRGTKSDQEILNTIADSIESGEAVSVDYLSAPGEPAGAVTSNRAARRSIIEAFRSMPAALRSLWQKTFFADKVEQVGGGKIQIQGWAPEVVAANAHKLASAVVEQNQVKWWNETYPRFEIDPSTKSFTETGWRNLFDDAAEFSSNQRAGLTGSGEQLVVPASVEARGFKTPEQTGTPGARLDQGSADVISALYGIPVPKTPTIRGVFPRNLAAQEVSEATMPGRVSPLVEPRKPFSGARAEELGIAGRELQEVNPFRAALEEKGIKPSFIEAVQRLNLENVADVGVIPKGTVPELRAKEFTLQAGFQPKAEEPRAIKSAAIQVTVPGGKPQKFTGKGHADALKKAEDAIPLDEWVESRIDEGFVTNEEEFLGRVKAYDRAVEIGQITPQSGIKTGMSRTGERGFLEAEGFEEARKFQVPAIEEISKSDFADLSAMTKGFTGRYGGGLTGLAYELGAGLKDAAQLKALDEARAKHVAASKSALAAKDYATAALEGNKAQLFREASEFATGTGSAAGRMAQDYPGYVPPLREGTGAQFATKAIRKGKLVEPRETRGVFSRQRRAADWQNVEDLNQDFAGRVQIDSLRDQVKDGIEDFYDRDAGFRKLATIETITAGKTSAEVANELYRDVLPSRGYPDKRILRYIEEKNPELRQRIEDFIEYQREAELEYPVRESQTEPGGYSFGDAKQLKSNGYLATQSRRFAREKLLDLGLSSDEANLYLKDWPGEGREVVQALDAPLADWIESFVYESKPFRSTKFQPGKGNKEVEAVAVKYTKRVGLPYKSDVEIAAVNTDLAKRLADFYEAAENKPSDPEVTKSYDALAKETMDQWREIEEAGYTLEPFEGKGEPYKNSAEMMADVRDNKHLYFLKTTPETIKAGAENPMLETSGVGDLTINDAFRAVHDFFGHAKQGNQFGPKGELNAWRIHSEMYSPEAQGALAAETLAQNSWVNYGKHLRDASGKVAAKGEKGFVAATERPFAEQKNIVIPQELIDEAKAGEGAKFSPRKAAKRPEDEPGYYDKYNTPAAPPAKTSNYSLREPISGGFFKAWVTPDGELHNTGGTLHFEWLSKNAEDVSKRFGVPIEEAKLNDDSARESALQKGFARVNLSSANGRLTIELRAADLRKLKKPIYDLVEANADKIDRITIGLMDENSKTALDSETKSVFQFDTKGKLDNIPFVTGSEYTGGTGEVTAPRGPSAIAIARARQIGGEEGPQFQPRQEEIGLPGFETPGKTAPSKAEIANMTRAELKEVFPEAVIPKSREDTLGSEITDSPLYKEAGSESAAVEAFAKRLVKFAREYEDRPEYKAGLKWYSEFTPMLKKAFGKDAQLFAELLAATSPQTSPVVNFGYAFDALKSLKSGRFAKIIPKFEEGLAKIEDGSWEKWYDKQVKAGKVANVPQNPSPASFMAHWIETNNLKPTQTNGKLYGQHSVPVLQVFARRWLEQTAGPKTQNFVRNLLGLGDEATVDLWADRSMRWAGYEGKADRWRILPENQGAVSDADFAFAQKAFRRAAEKLGVKPSALQGALWFGEKQRWSDNGWSSTKDLGDYRAEMQKIPALEKGFERRVKEEKAAKKAPKQTGFDLDVEPRYK